MGGHLERAIGATPQVAEVRAARERLREHIVQCGEPPAVRPPNIADDEQRVRRTLRENVLAGRKLPNIAELSAVRGLDAILARDAAGMLLSMDQI